MVDPDRGPLAGLVEVDETSLPFRAGGEPVRPGRSHGGKLLVAGAVEIKGKGPGRVRLAVIEDYPAASLGGFVAGNVADGSTVVSDGWPGYGRLKDVKHDPKVVGETPAHLVLPWIHRVFANAKRWALGVYHGLRPKHLQPYLDEFVFRFTRRGPPAAPFTACSASASPSSPPPTRCWSSGAKGISHSVENGIVEDVVRHTVATLVASAGGRYRRSSKVDMICRMGAPHIFFSYAREDQARIAPM